MVLRKIFCLILYSLGAKIYSLLFFANAIGACVGIFASLELLPLIGYEGVFIFYGTLTIISGLLLITFTDKTGVKRVNAKYVLKP